MAGGLERCWWGVLVVVLLEAVVKCECEIASPRTEERPVVTRFFLFSPTVFNLLRWTVLRLPGKVLQCSLDCDRGVGARAEVVVGHCVFPGSPWMDALTQSGSAAPACHDSAGNLAGPIGRQRWNSILHLQRIPPPTPKPLGIAEEQ